MTMAGGDEWNHMLSSHQREDAEAEQAVAAADVVPATVTATAEGDKSNNKPTKNPTDDDGETANNASASKEEELVGTQSSDDAVGRRRSREEEEEEYPHYYMTQEEIQRENEYRAFVRDYFRPQDKTVGAASGNGNINTGGRTRAMEMEEEDNPNYGRYSPNNAGGTYAEPYNHGYGGVGGSSGPAASLGLGSVYNYHHNSLAPPMGYAFPSAYGPAAVSGYGGYVYGDTMTYPYVLGYYYQNLTVVYPAAPPPPPASFGASYYPPPPPPASFSASFYPPPAAAPSPRPYMFMAPTTAPVSIHRPAGSDHHYSAHAVQPLPPAVAPTMTQPPAEPSWP